MNTRASIDRAYPGGPFVVRVDDDGMPVEWAHARTLKAAVVAACKIPGVRSVLMMQHRGAPYRKPCP